MSFELGRGLDSLISKLPESTNSETGITTVKIEFIHPVSKDLISIVATTPSDAIWDACNI